MEKPRPGAVTSLAVAAAVAMLASVTPGGARAVASAPAWQPEPATYGIGEDANVPVTMADGTVLRVDVYFPTLGTSGVAAPGPFPVLIQQTPYTKTGLSVASRSSAATANGGLAEQPYLIQRGYIDVVADVRGTGESQGTWGLFDPVQQQDGATLVRWAARLPHSSARVGLYGPSYMGIDQILTANALGPGSPLQALFPFVTGNDLYRDILTMGGIPDLEFSAVYMGLMAGLNSLGPLYENPADPVGSLQALADHAPGLISLQAKLTLAVLGGGAQAYDESYWQLRNPRTMLDHLVTLGIPAYLVGGWFDLFQRGEPLNYSGLQNAFSHRPVGAPMLPDQAVTGRYQLLQGPWYHLNAGAGVDMERLMLAWFDRWLKDIPTGIDQTSTPLHLYQLGSGRWVDTARYPLDQLTPTTLYLAGGPSGSGAPSLNDGRLVATPGGGAPGADSVVYIGGVASPCSRQLEQWGAGPTSLAFGTSGLPPQPCTVDDRTLQVGPGALTYTTDPMPRDTVVGGPIDASLFVTSTRPEIALEATLEDIAPGGASYPLTGGALAGSLRAVDGAQSWYAADGRPLLPYHPFTRASTVPVTAGQVTRLDVEVYPTFARLAAGHRLRLTLNTSDTPHLLATAPQQANLVGGVYAVQRTAAAASFVEIPMAPASVFATSAAPQVPVGAPAVSAAGASAPSPALANTTASAQSAGAGPVAGLVLVVSLAIMRTAPRRRRRGSRVIDS